jgi:V/A-type H+-transporting ATPase subunit E
VGTGELQAALRREGERKAAAIRQVAETEAARLQEEYAARYALLEEECRQKQEKAIAAEESGILAEAERAARRVRLAAAENLAERLHALARRLLPRLRTGDYPVIFARLAGELPAAEWETLRVNPADANLAGALFPGAQIETDAAICGGLEALAAGGRVQVVNTLEKRLERRWPELLPVLLREIDSDA